MKLDQYSPLLTATFSFAICLWGGCATHERLVSRQNDSDTVALLEQVDAIDPDSAGDGASVTPATLVSEAPAKKELPALIHLASHEDLDRVIEEAPGAVLLDFYADWCGPCRRQGQILNSMKGIARENNTTIIKIDVDEHEELAKSMSVSSLPTLIMIRDGDATHRNTGLASKQKLVEWMKSNHVPRIASLQQD